MIRTPNGWSCLAASFATILGISFEEVIERIGHDGSEIVFPEAQEPECRRAFHPQEMIDLCHSFGKSVTPIEARPTSRPRGVIRSYEVELGVPRFQQYLEEAKGVLTGLNLRNRPHAVAWVGEECLDPATGRNHGVHLFQPDTFWRVNDVR